MDIRKGKSLELIMRKTSQMLSIDSLHLNYVKYCGRFGKTVNVKLFHKLRKGEDLIFTLGCPTKKGDAMETCSSPS